MYIKKSSVLCEAEYCMNGILHDVKFRILIRVLFLVKQNYCINGIVLSSQQRRMLSIAPNTSREGCWKSRACKKPDCDGLQEARLRWPARSQTVMACKKPDCDGLQEARLRWPARSQTAMACKKPDCDGLQEARL